MVSFYVDMEGINSEIFFLTQHVRTSTEIFESS